MATSDSSIISALNTAGDRFRAAAANISNLHSYGYKREFVESLAIAGSHGVSSSSTTLVSEQGALTYTGLANDLAIDGHGMFIVKDKYTNEILYTRTGYFHPNNEGVLEAHNRYLLMGWQYDGDSNLIQNQDPKQLAPIRAMGLFKAPKPTSEIDMTLRLSSDVISGGDGGSLIIGAANDATARSSDILDLGQNYLDTAFTVEIKKPNGGTTDLQRINCMYGGIIKTGEFNPDDNLLATAGNANDLLTITIDGNKAFQSQRSDFAASGVDNITALNQLLADLNMSGMRARITTNPNGKLSLLISPPSSNSSISLSNSSTGMLQSLGIDVMNSSVPKAGKNIERFASMEDLQGMMSGTIGSVRLQEGDSNSAAKLLVIPWSGTSVSMHNDQNANLLKQLGMVDDTYIQSTHIQSAYDPYNPAYNIAGGNIRPDIVQTVAIYDSANNAHSITFAMKRLQSKEWVVETYASNAKELADDSMGGVLQSSLLRFDNEGKLISVGVFAPAAYSETSVYDPMAPLGFVDADTLVINGETFNGGQFESLVDLVDLIKKNPNLQDQVIPAVVFSEGQYQLKLTAAPTVPLDITGTIAIKLQMKQPAKIFLPDIEQPININWAESVGAEPNSVLLKWNENGIFAAASNNNVSILSNGGRSAAMTGNVKMDENGTVNVEWDDNTSDPIYRLPIAVFVNYDGMAVRGAQMYGRSAESGPPRLQFSGEAGAGIVRSETAEASTVNDSNSVIEVERIVMYHSLAALALKENNAMNNTLLGVLGVR